MHIDTLLAKLCSFQMGSACCWDLTLGPTLGTCLELGAAGAGGTVGVLGPKVPHALHGTRGPETKLSLSKHFFSSFCSYSLMEIEAVLFLV